MPARTNELHLSNEMPLIKVTTSLEHLMFTSVSSRSATAYQRVSVETSVSGASPYQLVNLLFQGLLRHVGAARVSLARGDLAAKGEHITKAVRIIDEALKPALNSEAGGDIAANLSGLYGYCSLRLTQANLLNDEAALRDVLRVIEPLADGWKGIGEKVGN
jgi:flagellar protein FliS